MKEVAHHSREKAVMTDKERVRALLRREKPDRVPIWPIGGEVFAVLQEGGDIVDAWKNQDKCIAALRRVSEEFGWVFWPRIVSAAVIIGPYGGEIRYPSGDYAFAPTVARRPVATVEEAVNLKLPDVRNSGFMSEQVAFYKKSSQENIDNMPFGVTLVGNAFTHAAEICGPETFVRWLIKKPEAAHHLLRIAVDFTIEQAKYWKELFGTENVLPYVGEPTASNQLISPQQFEQFTLPYLKELCEKILDLGYQHICWHICGEQNLNLPHWTKIPRGNPGIVSIGHEVTLRKAAEYFPKDIIFGNLEPAIIQTSTPEEVYQAARKVVEDGKTIAGGFIMSSGCTFPPRAPRENVEMITKAVNDFGWYD